MSDAPSSLSAAVLDVRRALDAVLDAMRGADVTALDACEARLASAVASLSATGVTAEDVRRLGVEIGGARASLRRCRRAGSAIADVTSAVLAAAGVGADYDRAGHAATRATRIGCVQARV